MTNWRDVLPVHPAAEIFPMMSEAELRELGNDIKRNGQQSKVVLWKDASHRLYLLDGRSRLAALELIGEAVNVKDGFPSVPWCFLEGDPYDIALSLNLHRRHLDADQKRGVVEKAVKAHPERSNRRIAKETDSSHPHVAKVRKELEKAGDVETVTTSIDTKGRKQPATKKKATAKLNGQPVDVSTLGPKAKEAIAAAVDHAPNLEPKPVSDEPDTVPATEKSFAEAVDSGMALRFFKNACDHFLLLLNKEDAAKARVYFYEWTAKAVKAEAKAKAAAA